MDKKYVTLFKDLAQATAASAEQVMEYDRGKGDEKGLESATMMRDDFQALVGRIAAKDFVMTKSDAARLLVASTIQVNQLKDRIEALKQAMTGYQTDIIPKLQQIMDAETDEDAQKLAEEKFIIGDNE
jgi:hypothetical protein